MSDVKHPEVSVELVGQDGNAFAIIGRVVSAMRSAGVQSSEINEFRKQAMSGNYDHLLQVVMDWVNIDYGDDEEEDFDNWDDEDDDDWNEDDDWFPEDEEE